MTPVLAPKIDTLFTSVQALHVGVDIAPVQPPLTGIGNYALYLLMALLGDAERPVVSGFGRWRWANLDVQVMKRAAARSDQVRTKLTSNALRGVARFAGRSSILRAGASLLRRQIFQKTCPKSLSIFHAFAFVPPGRLHCPTIPVVYDLSFVRFPEAHPVARLYSLKGLHRHLEQAPIVHTISEFSAGEISQVFGVPRSRIEVIYPGVNRIFMNSVPGKFTGALAKFSLSPGYYFLSLSTLEPRKNIRTLVQAYSRMDASTRQKIPLCIAGAAGWGMLNLPNDANRLQAEGTLKFLGYISNSELRDLYSCCRAFFYPSFYEGFGMPVAEALACGASVVASDTASLPEAGGKCARYVAPHDSDAWLEELQRAADSAPFNPVLVDARRAFSSQFSWRAAAKTTLNMYAKVAGADGRPPE